MNLKFTKIEDFIDFIKKEEIILYNKNKDCFIDIEEVGKNSYVITAYSYHDEGVIVFGRNYTASQLIAWLHSANVFIYDMNTVKEIIVNHLIRYDLIFMFGNNPVVITDIDNTTQYEIYLTGFYSDNKITIGTYSDQKFYSVKPTELQMYLDVNAFTDSNKEQQVKVVAKPSIRKSIIDNIYKDVSKLLEEDFFDIDVNKSTTQLPDENTNNTEHSNKHVDTELSEEDLINLFKNVFFN